MSDQHFSISAGLLHNTLLQECVCVSLHGQFSRLVEFYIKQWQPEPSVVLSRLFSIRVKGKRSKSLLGV